MSGPLPTVVKEEVKELLKLQKTEAGTTPYKTLKTR